MYHEMHLEKLQELEQLQVNSKKDLYLKEKAIKDTKQHYKNKILQSEKYNNEVAKIVNENRSLNEFVENSTDLFNKLTDLIIENPEKLQEYFKMIKEI
jgi:hypothetical protein